MSAPKKKSFKLPTGGAGMPIPFLPRLGSCSISRKTQRTQGIAPLSPISGQPRHQDIVAERQLI
jgi:hypothetical protein